MAPTFLTHTRSGAAMTALSVSPPSISTDADVPREQADSGAAAPVRCRGASWGSWEDSMTKFRANPWAVLLVVSLGFLMTLLDLTIVNIAVPNLITNLHASLDDVLWVINAYALVLAVLVITAGRLGDLIGPPLMFTTGIAVFTPASAASGLAPSPGR